MKPRLFVAGCAACWLLFGAIAPPPAQAEEEARQAPARPAKPAPKPAKPTAKPAAQPAKKADAPATAADARAGAAQPAGVGKAEVPGSAVRPGMDVAPQPAGKGAAPASAGAPVMEVVAGRPGGPGSPRVTLPLAPTREELERRQRAADAAQALTDQGRPPPRESLRRVPTQTGNTAGPGTRAGAGTLHDRKASTLEMTGPTHGVRR